MTLRIHHVFVCTSKGAPEASTLLDSGLVEGSGNTHPGQGTSNRRFFFKRGYLELLWVHDEREARSELATPTQLWDRWAGRSDTACPFGLCFSSSEGLNSELPFPTWGYRPTYLEDGRHILFADQLPLSEPEVFVLDWPQTQASPGSEPRTHPIGLGEMHAVSVGLASPTSISRALSAIKELGLVEVHRSKTPELLIEFEAQQEITRSFPELGLTLLGRPSDAACL